MSVKSLGICIGAATVSFVRAEKNNGKIKILSVKSLRHDGNPKKIISSYFKKNDCGNLLVMATGKKFRETLNTKSMHEPAALEEAIKFLGWPANMKLSRASGQRIFLFTALTRTAV